MERKIYKLTILQFATVTETGQQELFKRKTRKTLMPDYPHERMGSALFPADRAQSRNHETNAKTSKTPLSLPIFPVSEPKSGHFPSFCSPGDHHPWKQNGHADRRVGCSCFRVGCLETLIPGVRNQRNHAVVHPISWLICGSSHCWDAVVYHSMP